jgi:hypothetical protein
MSSEEPPNGELRELIYIDDESVNGHLSSMGVGLETGIDESSGSTEDSRARFFGNINVPGLPIKLGGEGEKHRQQTDNIETEIDITTPYRLQTLREIIKASGSKIKNPGEEGVGYKDVVEITGVVEPMSLFRFELAETVTITINEATQKMKNAMEEINGLSPSEIESEESDVRANEVLREVSMDLNDKRVPVRMDVEGTGVFGALLDREKMLVPETHAFSRPRPYTLFGRVERRIKSNSRWEPTDTMRLGKHFTDMEDELDEFSENIKSAAEGHGVVMNDEHLNISGPAKIVHPIALYW